MTEGVGHAGRLAVSLDLDSESRSGNVRTRLCLLALMSCRNAVHELRGCKEKMDGELTKIVFIREGTGFKVRQKRVNFQR